MKRNHLIFALLIITGIMMYIGYKVTDTKIDDTYKYSNTDWTLEIQSATFYATGNYYPADITEQICSASFKKITQLNK